jgi:hypothetical protein
MRKDRRSGRQLVATIVEDFGTGQQFVALLRSLPNGAKSSYKEALKTRLCHAEKSGNFRHALGQHYCPIFSDAALLPVREQVSRS